jgi:hypothetical protein
MRDFGNGLLTFEAQNQVRATPVGKGTKNVLAGEILTSPRRASAAGDRLATSGRQVEAGEPRIRRSDRVTKGVPRSGGVGFDIWKETEPRTLVA